MNVIRMDPASIRYRTPLVVRASLPRTFRGLCAFAEIGLFSCGIYLLAEAALKPLEADQASILGAGVLLALASVLLFYIVRPHRRDALMRPDVRRSSWDSCDPSDFSAGANSAEDRRDAARTLLDKQDLPGPM